MSYVQLTHMDNLNKSILVALLDLSQLDTSASVQALSERLGCPRREVACGLAELDRLGLVRAAKVRLTMLGLVKAASLRARRGQTLAA